MDKAHQETAPSTAILADSATLPEVPKKDFSGSMNNLVWQQCIVMLQAEMDQQEINKWVIPLHCEISKESIWLGAPNRYIVDHVKESSLTRIQEILQELLGDPAIAVTIQIGTAEDLSVLAKQKATPRRAGTRGRTSESVVEQAQMDLFRLERQGQFQAIPISPQNEFPTILTRLPIFVPGRASKQKAQIDEDFAIPFQTSWGTGRKFGPPLTVYDEDTLIALSHLRQNMLIGSPSKMPYPVSRLYAREDQEEVHVHVVFCMLSDVQAMCGTSVGGRNNKLRLDSIKRLAATKIEFNKETQNKVGHSGTNIDLVHVKWDVYEEKAIFYIQFSPIMATWLETAYTYVDWNLRRKLSSDVAKAVHRFLSGQPGTYNIFTKKLKDTIGHVGPYKHFMADLRETMTQLKDEGWLKEFQIQGNGRKMPHKLIINRK